MGLQIQTGLASLFVLVATGTLVACGGGDDGSNNVLSGAGESCTKTADCESGLKCVALVCQQAGAECPGDQECSGLECGPDPVCGESCGTCGGGESCQAGKCVQGGPDCPADKDCSGLECGSDPVCGESCGTCGGGESCQAGVCVDGPCEPDCSGLECGPDPVCGESCGTCGGGDSCQAGQCVQGGPDCPADKDCSGLECGADPVCGESCGSCGGGESCQAGQCVGGTSGDTWKDPSSGLTWQVTPTGGYMNWSDAKSHCAGLSLDGGGWHLPTIGELRTLIRGCPATEDGGSCNVEEGDCLAWSCWDDSCDGCSYNDGPADGCYWPDNMQGTCSSWYWSSSPVEDFGIFAWGVGFNYGVVNGGVVDNDGHVRCVR